MRVLLIFLSLSFSLIACATPEKEVRSLFMKYDSIMDHHKVELIDDVFTQKFLTESGGKEEFIEKVQSLPKKTTKSEAPEVTVKKGLKDKIYFAKLKNSTNLKSKDHKEEHGGSQFIIVEEEGKLKIDGTLSDDN